MNNRYIKSIDGLRVIALLGVFLYHLIGSFVPSGYLGVVIFFTLAGFLSMQVIVERENNISIIEGLTKVFNKIKKLMPVLIFVVFLVSIVMMIWFNGFLKAYPIDAISAIFSFSNYAQIFKNESYFEAMNSLKPLTHIWALSLEMQFYIIFYIFVYTTYKKERKNTFLLIFTVIFIFSVLLSIFLINKGTNLTRVYYGVDTRISTFVLGMIAAILTTKFKNIKITKNILVLGETLFAIILIASMFVDFKTDMQIIIGINIYSFVSVFLIMLLYINEIYINKNSNIVTSIFSSKAVHNIVARSYIIYLVHYPIIIFFNRFFAHIIISYYLYIFLIIVITIIITELLYQASKFLFNDDKVIKKWISILIFMIGIIFICIYAKNSNLESAYTKEENVDLIESNDVENIKENIVNEIEINEPTVENKELEKATEIVYKKFVPKSISEVDINDHLIQMAFERIALVNQNIGDAAKLDFNEFLSYRDMKITLIGDSVSECAKGALSVYFPYSYINAEGNRQISKAVNIFNEMKANGKLGDVVVVALGTNCDKDIDIDALDTIYYATEGRPMVVLTVITPIMVEEMKRNKALRTFAANHPNCYLGDWYAAMKTHAEYFQGDNTHPKDLGNDVFAQVIFKTCVDALKGTKDDINTSKEYKFLSEAKVNNVIKFGSYFINNEIEKEDIEWVVLGKDDITHTMLLMSKDALDCKKFNESYESMSWTRSSLRKWLNETFFAEAFTDEEKTYIKEKGIDNRKNPIYETSDGGVTKDKIFVLSYEECDKYLDKELLKCKGTEYFVKNNGWIDSEKGYEGNCDWWLRTPGDMNNNFMNVSSKGEIIFSGDYSTTDDFGVRPCINVRYE